MKVDLGESIEEGLDRFERINTALRDQFATAALQGMLQSAPVCDRTQIDKKKWCAIAYEWADVMIEARATAIFKNRKRK